MGLTAIRQNFLNVLQDITKKHGYNWFNSSGRQAAAAKLAQRVNNWPHAKREMKFRPGTVENAARASWSILSSNTNKLKSCADEVATTLRYGHHDISAHWKEQDWIKLWEHFMCDEPAPDGWIDFEEWADSFNHTLHLKEDHVEKHRYAELANPLSAPNRSVERAQVDSLYLYSSNMVLAFKRTTGAAQPEARHRLDRPADTTPGALWKAFSFAEQDDPGHIGWVSNLKHPKILTNVKQIEHLTVTHFSSPPPDDDDDIALRNWYFKPTLQMLRFEIVAPGYDSLQRFTVWNTRLDNTTNPLFRPLPLATPQHAEPAWPDFRSWFTMLDDFKNSTAPIKDGASARTFLNDFLKALATCNRGATTFTTFGKILDQWRKTKRRNHEVINLTNLESSLVFTFEYH